MWRVLLIAHWLTNQPNDWLADLFFGSWLMRTCKGRVWNVNRLNNLNGFPQAIVDLTALWENFPWNVISGEMKTVQLVNL